MNFNELDITKQWTLFLDRDGVINQKLPDDYVKKVEEFKFEEGALASIRDFSRFFNRIVVVTNQQGIGKGLMTKEDLKQVHQFMEREIKEAGGSIDKIYYCPDLAENNTICRKPNTGMAEEARQDFPEIEFKKSIMVGDSLSDMQMGKRVGMTTVFISDMEEYLKEADFIVKSLAELASKIDGVKK